MHYLLRYYKEQTQLVGLFFKKGVLEFVVKILDKYTNKQFLKIPFLDHNYYNNSLKYAANRTVFSKTFVIVITKSEVFIKDF